MSAKKSPRWSPVSSHDHNMNVFTTVEVFNVTWFYITFDVKLATIILFLQKCHKTVGKVFGCMYRHHCYCLQSTNPQVSSANTPRWGWGGVRGVLFDEYLADAGNKCLFWVQLSWPSTPGGSQLTIQRQGSVHSMRNFWSLGKILQQIFWGTWIFVEHRWNFYLSKVQLF